MATNDEITEAKRVAELALLQALAGVLVEKQGAWIGQALNLAQAYAVVASGTPGGAFPED